MTTLDILKVISDIDKTILAFKLVIYLHAKYVWTAHFLFRESQIYQGS